MKFPYLKIPREDPRKKWISRPIIPITLFGPEGSVNIDALIDSGADRCLFNAQIGREIGLNIERGEKETFSGIEGGRVEPIFIKFNFKLLELIKKLKLLPDLLIHQEFLQF